MYLERHSSGPAGNILDSFEMRSQPNLWKIMKFTRGYFYFIHANATPCWKRHHHAYLDVFPSGTALRFSRDHSVDTICKWEPFATHGTSAINCPSATLAHQPRRWLSHLPHYLRPNPDCQYEQVWLLTLAFDQHAESDIALFVSIGTIGTICHCHMGIIENWGICQLCSEIPILRILLGHIICIAEAMQKLDTAEAELSRLRGDLQVRRLRSHSGKKCSPCMGRWGLQNCSRTCEIRNMSHVWHEAARKDEAMRQQEPTNGCDCGMALDTSSFFGSNGLILWMSHDVAANLAETFWHRAGVDGNCSDREAPTASEGTWPWSRWNPERKNSRDSVDAADRASMQGCLMDWLTDWTWLKRLRGFPLSFLVML